MGEVASPGYTPRCILKFVFYKLFANFRISILFLYYILYLDGPPCSKTNFYTVLEKDTIFGALPVRVVRFQFVIWYDVVSLSFTHFLKCVLKIKGYLSKKNGCNHFPLWGKNSHSSVPLGGVNVVRKMLLSSSVCRAQWADNWNLDHF